MIRKFSKIKQIVLAILLLLSAFTLAFALTACDKEPEVPQVKNVTLTAAQGEEFGKVGSLHTLSFEAPEGSKISYTVTKGEATATAADYAFTQDGLIFYAEGAYKVTVSAAKDGMVGYAATETINVTAAAAMRLAGVKITAATGEDYGVIGELHLLSYNATSGSEISVEIKKNGVAASESDYAFDSRVNSVVFYEAGEYAVTVTAQKADASKTQTVTLTVSASAKLPTVTLSANKTAVNEDEAVILTHTVAYAAGEIKKSEDYFVEYKKTALDAFEEASADNYAILGDTFTPRLAGLWRVSFRAESSAGAAAEKSVAITANRVAAVQLRHVPHGDELKRIGVNVPAELSYEVTGATDKFDVSYRYDREGITAEQGRGNSVRLTATKTDYFKVTLVYTYKADSSVKEELDFTVYSVSSLAYAPTFGLDPFDGMPSTVLTSVGHLLYCNATLSMGNPLNMANVKYEVVETELSGANLKYDVEVLYVAGNKNFPYVIAHNYNENTMTGSFKLRMTVTDAQTMCSAVAEKDFDIRATHVGTGSNLDADSIQAFVSESAYYDAGNLNFDGIATDCRQNMVLTKSGAVMHCKNADWGLHPDGNGNSNDADFAHMDFEAAAANCRLEFTFKIYGTNPNNGTLHLGIGLRTVNQSGWCGFFDLKNDGKQLAVASGLVGGTSQSVGYEPLSVEGYKTYQVRIDRTVSGSDVTYTVYLKGEGMQTFQMAHRVTATVSESGCGAPVAQYQFTHRNAGGCYAVEDVRLTNFD